MSDPSATPVDGSPAASFRAYADCLTEALATISAESIERLSDDLHQAWNNEQQVFVCGNGGSAANAIHLANDFFYGVAPAGRRGLRIHALPANQAITTCLGNDVGYDQIFASQLTVLAKPKDVLIVLSGSGNSPNIVEALNQARTLGLRSHAIVGFDGGEASRIADNVLHAKVHNMQIAEDVQTIVGHACMQWLKLTSETGDRVV